MLLDRGARVDARDPEFEQTALMIAVREGHTAAVTLLLERGADVNAQTRIGPDAAVRPALQGHGLRLGRRRHQSRRPARSRATRWMRKGGMTPLLYAARDGRLDAARAAAGRGADLELADANGIRPLLMALLNNQLGVARLLLDRGANVNADDFWGRTPLWAAVEYRNLDMNNSDQDSPTDNGVDRAPFLD